MRGRTTLARPLRRVSFNQLKKEQKARTCISVFTGCGGAALGVSMAGFEVRVMVDWDESAVKTLIHNWTGRTKTVKQKREPAIIFADITKLPTERILEAAQLQVGEATLLEGGFPCQGFSTSNSNRSPRDRRNRLYLELVRILREALPRFFAFENVPGLVSMSKGSIIRMICNDFAACGYDLKWDILNAMDYGVPQDRRRVFFIGHRNDVLLMGKNGPELHMGAVAGKVSHPDWFEKRYPMKRLAKESRP